MIYAKNLIDFKKQHYKEHKKLFKSLKDSQAPETLFITCSDSRINPHLLTGSKPGDLFMVRNIGNIVPRYHEKEGEYTTISAIEYAILVLNVKNIVVCGHSNCGACAAIWQEDLPGIHVKKWLRQLNPVKKLIKIKKWSTQKERALITEQLGVILQLKRLLSYPYVKARYEAGELNIEGWYYDISKGNILVYDKKSKKFKHPKKGA